ncbi:hypothetical protein AYX14_04997 [Cryptococcus neoformans]|nr:hypothetical protein AYX14_04997 [Cryptococcus neoformans var. grubii]
MASNFQEAPTSDSDSERTLYDRPNRTSQTGRAESGHDSRSEIFVPYTAAFSSIMPAPTSPAQQPQVASLQPLKETRWQRPPFLPTLNAQPRLVSLIVVLTLLSGGLIAGWVVFVIHQNHIMVGEESPDNDGKDDDQELNPLILFVDAVFIIFIIGTISVLLLLIYRFSTQFRPPPSPSSTTSNPLDFLPEWCRTSLPALPTYREVVIDPSDITRHELEMTLPAYEDNRNNGVLVQSQSHENAEDRGDCGVSGAVTHVEGIARQMLSRGQGLMSYEMSEQVLATAHRQRQIQAEPRSSSLNVIVEVESVIINMEDIKERKSVEVEEGVGNGDEEEEKMDEIEVRLGV